MTTGPIPCTKCGTDVAHARRMKDSKGRFFCEPCAAALRDRAAAKLGAPAGPGVQAGSGEVAAPGSPVVAISAPPPPTILDDGTIALAEEPPRPAVRPTVGLENLQTCPDCGHPLGAASDICASCGFNRKTGFHIGKGNVVTDDGSSGRHVAKPCRKCGYDMTGSKTGRCPECGTINARMSSARRQETNTLKSMFVGPAIMISVGVAIALTVALIKGAIGSGSGSGGGGGSGGMLGALGAGVWFLAYYAVSLVVGFATYVGCSIAFVGFDEPLGVTFVRLAAVYAVTDACSSVLGAFLPGFVVWPLVAIVYLGMLMQIMELDWEDAWLVAGITYIVHVVVALAMFWVWATYF